MKVIDNINKVFAIALLLVVIFLIYDCNAHPVVCAQIDKFDCMKCIKNGAEGLCEIYRSSSCEECIRWERK